VVSRVWLVVDGLSGGGVGGPFSRPYCPIDAGYFPAFSGPRAESVLAPSVAGYAYCLDQTRFRE